MLRDLDTESLTFGEDDEFYRRLREFSRFYIERMRIIPRIILRCPCYCWTFVKYLARSITQLFIRKFISVIVFILSVSALPGSILILREFEQIFVTTYCLSFIACSMLSLIFKKGSFRYILRSRTELLENQKLLAESNCQYGHEAYQPAGYGTRHRQQPLQNTLENLREPRPGEIVEGEFDFPRSSSFEPLNCCNEISAGPSHGPECANRFTITHISDQSYDSDELPKRPFVAHLAFDAIKTFGKPLQIFGADSYEVCYSSDEEILSDDSTDLGEQKFELEADVHHSNLHKPLIPIKGGCSSAQPVSKANDESTTMVGSSLSSDLLQMDDQSSEPSCSSSWNNDKDERSA